MDIQTVRQRQSLRPRREPYWHALGTGQHVGYRRTDDGGHWIARGYDSATRARSYKALGDLDRMAAHEQFTAAVKAAREWFDHIGKGGRTDEITVKQACARYVDHMRKRNGNAAADDAQGRFKRHVVGDPAPRSATDPAPKIAADPVAGIMLAKLTARHVGEWRGRLESKPAGMAKRGAHCRVKTAQRERPRSPSANNRDMVALRAALNLALEDGHLTTDAAWRVKLKPTEKAGNRRTLYLSRADRRALIAALPADAAAFVTGLCLLPLRPGALASLTVADFNGRDGSLRVPIDKAGAGRSILLPLTAANLIRQQAKLKLPAAPLFARWDGRAWDRDSWKPPIRRAVESAGLPAGTTAYTLRHSTITDLIAPFDDAGKEMQGLDLFTVAALSGTSVAMIEKYYGKVRDKRAQEALAGLTL